MKQPSFKLSVDYLILGIASLGLVISGYLFYVDGSNDLKDAQNRLTPVGKFASSQNDVRRRIEAGLTWGNVNQNDSVYEGDSIFTGEDSQTRIELEGGGHLTVAPRSLVVIRSSNRKLEVDLQYGSMIGKVASAQPLLIKQDGQTQEISSANAEIRLVREQATKETRVQVLTGEVAVQQVRVTNSTNGTKKIVASAPTQVIKQDEVLQLSAEAAPVIKKLDTKLVAPADGKSIWVTPDQPVRFEWAISGGSQNTSRESRIEFSSDTRFKSVLHSADVSGTTYELGNENRPEGPFYWRVKPKLESDGLPTLPAQLAIFDDVPPTLTFPADHQVFTLNTEGGENSREVLLTWSDNAGSKSFEIQLARDSDFTSIVFEKKAYSTNEKTAPLPIGEYHWRVSGAHPERENPPWSRVQSFSIKDGARSPQAPILTSTTLDYEIPASVLQRLPASVSPQSRGVRPNHVVPFTWTPVEGAADYEVEVSQTPGFENAMKQSNSGKTFYAPEEVKPGPMYFRVRAKSAEGRVSPPSDVGQLSVRLPAPALKPMRDITEKFATQDELEKAQTDISLDWTPQPFASSYELELSSDGNFSKAKKFRLRENAKTVRVTEPVAYSARVRSLASDGTPISPYSEVRMAAYNKELLPPPPAPTKATQAQPKQQVGALATRAFIPSLHEPRAHSSLISLASSPVFVQFKWRPVKGASSYTLQISSDPSFAKVVSEVSARNSNFLFEKKLPPGQVYWRVRSNFGKDRFSEWSEVGDINVLYK